MAPQAVPIASVTLPEYWYERISRAEGLRRLEGRKLDPETKEAIRAEIPEETLHIIKLGRGAFRELAQYEDEPAHLISFLPARQPEEQVYELIVPVYRSEQYSDGKPRQLTGTEILRFNVTDT